MLVPASLGLSRGGARRVPAVGCHPRDRSARPGPPVGIQRRLRGEAAGSAAGLPRPPGIRGTAARPAGTAPGCRQDPGGVARIRPSAWGGDANHGRLLAASSGGRGEHRRWLLRTLTAGRSRRGWHGARFPHASHFGYRFLPFHTALSPLPVRALRKNPPEWPRRDLGSFAGGVFSRAQARWRGYKQRRTYLERLRYLQANAEAAIKVWTAREVFSFALLRHVGIAACLLGKERGFPPPLRPVKRQPGRGCGSWARAWLGSI